MLASKKGDININGRFGHSIKFGSNDGTQRLYNFQL